MDGELQVVHCDFFKMDPRYQEVVRPDVSSQAIFQNLGIKAVPWSAGNFHHSLKLMFYLFIYLFLPIYLFVYWMYM